MNPQSNPAGETAEQLLVRDILTAGPQATVGEIAGKLAGHRYDSIDTVYVVTADGRLVGAAPLGELLSHPSDCTLESLMRPEPPAVLPGMDQEWVATLARNHRLTSVPVTEPDGRLLGAVPALAMLDVLHREHVEDVHRLAGIVHGRDDARRAMEDRPWRRVLRRIPWLLVGLFGSMVAAGVMARFAAVLERDIAVAFFVPAIVYLADAIGTQTEAVAVRGLSLSTARLPRLLAGELLTGALIGAILGLLAFPAVLLSTGAPPLAAAVALAILAAGGVASFVGLIFPWLLSRAGLDPAYGSGPVATIIQDVLSLLVYFVAVLLIL